jgi:hypothetical protein
MTTGKFKKDFYNNNINRTDSSSLSKKEQLEASLDQIQSVTIILRDKGFVAATEVTSIDNGVLADRSDDLADLQFNIALHGDVT